MGIAWVSFKGSFLKSILRDKLEVTLKVFIGTSGVNSEGFLGYSWIDSKGILRGGIESGGILKDWLVRKPLWYLLGVF